MTARPTATAEGRGAMDRRALIESYLDAYNRGALDELDAFVTPGYIHNNDGAALTLAQFKRGAAWFRAAMPDFAVSVADTVGEGDRLAVRWVGRGTHRGTMFGEEPTGTTLTVYGTTIFRFEGDRIAEDWEVADEGDLRRQAGALAD
jgi:predicted ester cyclase